MTLTLEEVEHIAALARLELTAAEKEKFRAQLSAILEYAERLEELDTEAIRPTASVLPLRSVMRPDKIAPSLPRDDLLANAPAVEKASFKAPPILTEGP